MTHAVLLEVDLAGRPARLELTTPAGMLTLHPSADGTELHGNIVQADGSGVEHLALAWDPERELDVVGRPLTIAVGLHRRRESIRVGRTTEIEVVVIRPSLAVNTGRRSVERAGEGSWRIAAAEGEPHRLISIDADGLPAYGQSWALERD
jgi:hypothetical protein